MTLITTIEHKPPSQKYFQKKIHWNEFKLERNLYDTSPFSPNTYKKCFQYKVFNNVLFLNKNFFSLINQIRHYALFVKKKIRLFHLYFGCPNVINLWNQLKVYLAEDLTLTSQTLQTVVFGFSEKDNAENVILYNHLFLIFKL